MLHFGKYCGIKDFYDTNVTFFSRKNFTSPRVLFFSLLLLLGDNFCASFLYDAEIEFHIKLTFVCIKCKSNY